MNAQGKRHIRLQTGFYPDWFHKQYGISFDRKYYMDPERLFNQYLIPAMNEVGDKFERKEIFVPEMMIAARSMQACMDLLKPLIRKEAAVSWLTMLP